MQSQGDSEGHSIVTKSGNDFRGTQDEQMIAYKTGNSNYSKDIVTSTPYPDKDSFSKY